MTTQDINLCIFCGARPNFIKVAPIIRVINKLSESDNTHKVGYSLVYAGSEDDPTLEDKLFEELSIHRPEAHLLNALTIITDIVNKDVAHHIYL